VNVTGRSATNLYVIVCPAHRVVVTTPCIESADEAMPIRDRRATVRTTVVGKVACLLAVE
jgi:hypothetical protein